MARITVIYGNGDPIRLHKAECRDAAREARYAVTTYTAEYDTAQEAAEDFYQDLIAEGSMTEADAINETIVLPCCTFATITEGR